MPFVLDQGTEWPDMLIMIWCMFASIEEIIREYIGIDISTSKWETINKIPTVWIQCILKAYTLLMNRLNSLNTYVMKEVKVRKGK